MGNTNTPNAARPRRAARLPRPRPTFRDASHVAPDSITAAADLAAVVYFAVDMWGHKMNDETLALWREAAAIARRIDDDARKGGQ
jgi:hypothetical protein